MTELVDVDVALATLLEAITPLSASERVALDAAPGRVAAESARGRDAVPPFSSSAMDGYAVDSGDAATRAGESLRVAGRTLAGQPPATRLRPGEAVRIFTGAALPPGADCVIPQEDAERPDAQRVRLPAAPVAGRYVRPAGMDARSGEILLRRGTRLHAGHIGLMAAAGVGAVTVTPRPRVAILTTGDELRPVEADLAPGEIHDCARHFLPALLRHLPVTTLVPVRAPDEREALTAEVESTLAMADALIVVGGMSVGEADHVRDVIAARGELDLWRLALKPGKPFGFGRVGGRPVFGLPGNPVSALVTALLLVRPALLRLAGAEHVAPPTFTAPLLRPARKTPGRRDLQRGIVTASDDGTLAVEPLERQDSNLLSGITTANCLIDLPRAQGDVPAGAAVRVLPFAGLLD